MSRVVIVCNTTIYFIRFRQELVERLNALGHEVTLIAPRDRGSLELQTWPLRWIEWPFSQHGMNPLSELRALWFLERRLCGLRPEVLVNFTVKPAIYGSIAARRTGCKHVASVFTGLGRFFTEPKGGMRVGAWVISVLLRVALRTNASVFFQNSDDAQLFVLRGLVRPQLVRLLRGSGVNLDRFAPRPVPRAPHFLMIGRPLVEKGVYEFVSAARIVKSSYPQVRFTLVGGAENEPTAVPRGELQKWVAEGVIDYLGEIPDVRPLIERASVVVLPSYREGTPRSLLEALAMQRAVVTCDSPGCRETVREGLNGFLVPVRDARRLAEAITRFVVDPGLAERMGGESRRLAVECFDVDMVNGQLLSALGLEAPRPPAASA